jgi:hypothetical protein
VEKILLSCLTFPGLEQPISRLVTAGFFFGAPMLVDYSIFFFANFGGPAAGGEF